ncbi:MAG: diaminopimelate epimerase [Candidatus Thermoplasmatota archaeon]|nr:diaminopimelate epimerase [Candidatus Thermoplasmatota archaeon]
MSRRFAFEKYHGCGNDFIVADEMQGRKTSDRERSRLARMLTDRHFGIGADGVIFVERARGVDGSMRLFEPAGNEADMCGNGIRCVGAHLMDKLGLDEVEVLSKDGIKKVVRAGREYSVEMGRVRTSGRHLKAYYSGVRHDSDSMMNVRIRTGGRSLVGALVNSGEPHFVTRTSDLRPLKVSEMGDAVNANKRLFPRGVNLNFVQVASPHTIRIRTYERGVYDETLACGTGATASAAVSLLLGWVRPGPVTVFAEGGRMRISVRDDGTIVMSGPAVRVFEGTLELPLGPGLRLSCP